MEVETIDILGLGPRPYSALSRAGIITLQSLVSAVRQGTISSVRNLGAKSIAEIEVKLQASGCMERYPDDIGESRTAAEPEHSLDDLLTVAVARAQEETLWAFVEWQLGVLERHLSDGLLHPKCSLYGLRLGPLLDDYHDIEPSLLHTVACRALEARSIANELEWLLAGTAAREIVQIALPRFGLSRATLQDVGESLSLSRKRVEQIERQLGEYLGRRICDDWSSTSTSGPAELTLLKCQSALFLAADMGPQIEYDIWYERVRALGLQGKWTVPEYRNLDTVETLVALCRLIGKHSDANLRLPVNLERAFVIASRRAVGRRSPDLS